MDIYSKDNHKEQINDYGNLIIEQDKGKIQTCGKHVQMTPAFTGMDGFIYFRNSHIRPEDLSAFGSGKLWS